MNFKHKYPNLFQFFAGYFPESDFDGLSDEEVVASYIADCNKSEKSKTELEQSKKELISLMDNIEDYWEEISQKSNRYFENPTDTLEWLNMISCNLHE